MSAVTRQLSGTHETIRLFSRRMEIPFLGEVAVPPPDKLASYAGVGVLAALQVIEWRSRRPTRPMSFLSILPMAVVMVAGSGRCATVTW